jgi:hypothetical protein
MRRGKKKVPSLKLDETPELLKAAQLVTTAAKIMLTRRAVKRMIRDKYKKVLDKVNNTYMYKNTVTGEILATKPSFLGNDDLPSPRNFEAPYDYDIPPIASEEEGFALILTNQEFDSERIPDINKGVLYDHKCIRDIISHDFVGRIPESNLFDMINPTCLDYRNLIRRMKSKTHRKAYVVVYICTHVVTVWGQRKKTGDARENAFFIAKDSTWGATKATAQTCFPLQDFLEELNEVVAERKVVMLNFAHQHYRSPSLFGSKVLYPPPNILSTISDYLHCAAIGNCSIGTQISELAVRSPHIKQRLKRKLQASGFGTELELKKSKEAKEFRTKQELLAALNFPEDEIYDEWLAAKKFLEENGENDDEPGLTFSELVDELNKEWKITKTDGLHISERPPPPHPVWKEDEDKPGNCIVNAPTWEDTQKHERDVLKWKIKRIATTPYNFVKKGANKQAKNFQASPRQISLCHEESYSLFGFAVSRALEGGASREEEPMVSAQIFFETLAASVLEQANEIEETLIKDARGKAERSKKKSKGKEKEILLLENKRNTEENAEESEKDASKREKKERKRRSKETEKRVQGKGKKRWR